MFFLLSGMMYSSTASAQSYNCCDSISIYVQPDSTDRDSCSGYAFFKFKSDTICNFEYVQASGIHGGLVWDSVANSYKARYGTLRGTNLTITGTFYNNQWDSLCTKTYQIYCPSCCDSLNMTVIPDSTQIDSCTGVVYLSFDSTNVCGITNLVTNGTIGQPIWNTSLGVYTVKYATVRGTSLNINAYFRDNVEDTICVKNYTVSCDNCCDSVDVYYIANTGVSDSCRGFVCFKFDTAHNPCGINYVTSTGTFGQPVWDPILQVYKAPYAVAKHDNLTATGYFYDAYNNLICQKDVNIHCEEDFCCQGIILTDFPSKPNPDCCGVLRVTNNNSQCQIMSVIINNQVYDINNFNFNYCVTSGFSQTWIVYFIAPNGDTVCQKIFYKDCTGNGQRIYKQSGSNDKIDNSNVVIYPNPTTDKFKVSYNMKNAGNVSLEIYNVSGVLVQDKSMNHTSSGSYIYDFDVANLPNGIYIMRVNQNNEIQNIRFAIVK